MRLSPCYTTADIHSRYRQHEWDGGIRMLQVQHGTYVTLCSDAMRLERIESDSSTDCEDEANLCSTSFSFDRISCSCWCLWWQRRNHQYDHCYQSSSSNHHHQIIIKISIITFRVNPSSRLSSPSILNPCIFSGHTRTFTSSSTPSHKSFCPSFIYLHNTSTSLQSTYPSHFSQPLSYRQYQYIHHHHYHHHLFTASVTSITIISVACVLTCHF